ncbi:hypothetical protein M9H77_35951 [Catharanthus roseus]|uniref:Uncharacterized protein n=1 Tax=Catharanthus roseus TaxID=4058 RepID=A0ACB9ZT10_CATRO|nr:hypothetical protein M9H77_35951 [Catharanthus roseus]
MFVDYYEGQPADTIDMAIDKNCNLVENDVNKVIDPVLHTLAWDWPTQKLSKKTLTYPLFRGFRWSTPTRFSARSSCSQLAITVPNLLLDHRLKRDSEVSKRVNELVLSFYSGPWIHWTKVLMEVQKEKNLGCISGYLYMEVRKS